MDFIFEPQDLQQVSISLPGLNIPCTDTNCVTLCACNTGCNTVAGCSCTPTQG
ncbi:MAG: hypothetical protein AB1746_06320 [Candidatus Zixiibacteriota bacterium]